MPKLHQPYTRTPLFPSGFTEYLNIPQHHWSWFPVNIAVSQAHNFKTNWPKTQALHTRQGFKTRLTAWVYHTQLFNAWTIPYRRQHWWVHQALKGLAENCGLIWSCSGTFCQKIAGCDKLWAGIMGSTGKEGWFSFDLLSSIICEMTIGKISAVFCGDRDSCKWRHSNDHHRCHCFPPAIHHTGQLRLRFLSNFLFTPTFGSGFKLRHGSSYSSTLKWDRVNLAKMGRLQHSPL